MDWWIHFQWLEIKTRREYSTLSHKVFALKKTKLTEVRTIRYADDFKLFCRDRGSAEKMFKLVKTFLKDRLKLEISQKKSKVVNLRRQYSYFLGIKFKVVKQKKKYTIKSHISEKSIKEIKRKIRGEIKEIQRR